MGEQPDDQIRRALITGVSRGIGLGLVNELLGRGWEVYGVSRTAPETVDVPERFHFCSVDLTQPVQVQDGIEELNRLQTEAAGSERTAANWDLVVLNAGLLGTVGDISTADLEEMKAVFDVNVWSLKTFLDSMFESGASVGQVVAISSGASKSGSRGFSGYAISKAALNMLVSLYSNEFPKTHFCAFAPGVVDTQMQTTLSGFDADDRYESIQRLQSLRASKEMWTPEDAAPILIDAMLKLPEYVPSGAFADVREERFHDANPSS